MNSSIYLFGKLNQGYFQYPNDYTLSIFQNFSARATSKTQIIIHRQDTLMYYGYIRKLDNDESRYIGFCVLLNDLMIQNIKSLFSLFEEIFTNMVVQGEILCFDDNGNTITIDGNGTKQQEIERVMNLLRGNISLLEKDCVKLPPVQYGVDSSEIKTFAVADVEKKEVIDATYKYSYTYILKNEDYEKAAYYRDQIDKYEKVKDQKVDPDKSPVITSKIMNKIVEEKTGIPVGDIQKQEENQLQNLASDLKAHVIGQDKAVEKVARAIRRNRIGFNKSGRPIGSFLFVGPTGVGKTELAKQLAKQMFGSEDAMIRFDMSEYMEQYSVSKLIGSAPGYVGYEEAGQLTEQVRHNPYSLILLDEIEKAHPDVLNLFLQILDDGRLTDSQGRTVSFKDTIIIMTSNAGQGIKNASVGFAAENEDESNESARNNMSQFFKPEFLNRLDDVIEFNELTKPDLLKIVDLMLANTNNMVKDQGIHIDVTDAAKEKLVDEELVTVNMNLGKTNVEGEGIEVILRETENEEISPINADDLLVIVNALKLAGAEAISINDERIINMTDIVNIDANTDNLFVRINGQRILAPYIIKAIGNQSYLESALVGKGGYVDELKTIGHDVEIEKVDKITILKYDDAITTKYMQ